jgi:HAD superfamily hydrolase (TIGR01509 family)
VDGVVTLDFHRTLVEAESWFELEVRELPAAFLRWRAGRDGATVPPGAEAAARTAYRRLRRQIVVHGHELPAERCVAVVLDEIGLPVELRAIAEGVEALMRETLVGAEPVPGAVETVRELVDHGATLGVVSSAVYHPFLEWSLERLGMRSAFTVVTTSASAGFYKSRPEIFVRALRALDAAPEASVHVGDSYRYDVQTARRAGMKTVWLSRDPASSDGHPPDLTLAGLEGAAAPILGLRGRTA